MSQFLSYYFHINNSIELIKKNPLKKFTEEKALSFFRRTKNKYYINNQIIIDKFIDFSNLEADINFIGKKLKINNSLYQDFKKISANTQYSNKLNIPISPSSENMIKNFSQELFELYKDIQS